MKKTAQAFVFVVTFVAFYVGLGMGLQVDPNIGTILWLLAMVLATLNIVWILRSRRTQQRRTDEKALDELGPEESQWEESDKHYEAQFKWRSNHTLLRGGSYSMAQPKPHRYAFQFSILSAGWQFIAGAVFFLCNMVIALPLLLQGAFLWGALGGGGASLITLLILIHGVWQHHHGRHRGGVNCSMKERYTTRVQFSALRAALELVGSALLTYLVAGTAGFIVFLYTSG